MKLRLICYLTVALIIVCTNPAFSGPILKPRKYHGPIPRSSLTLRVGFHGGASNEEMWTKLDAMAKAGGGEAFTDDFGNAFIVDAAYVYKLHPQFAIRANSSLAFFRSKSSGYFIPEVEDTAKYRPVYDFTRKFNTELIMVEGSGLYYFTDASVNEFQPYFGMGFSFGVPHAIYKQGLVDRDTQEVVSNNNDSHWSLEAGVHGMLGAIYYVSSYIAFNVEARYQITQTKFPIVIDTDEGQRSVNFDVDYTGFIINVGTSWAF